MIIFFIHVMYFQNNILNILIQSFCQSPQGQSKIFWQFVIQIQTSIADTHLILPNR